MGGRGISPVSRTIKSICLVDGLVLPLTSDGSASMGYGVPARSIGVTLRAGVQRANVRVRQRRHARAYPPHLHLPRGAADRMTTLRYRNGPPRIGSPSNGWAMARPVPAPVHAASSTGPGSPGGSPAESAVAAAGDAGPHGAVHLADPGGGVRVDVDGCSGRTRRRSPSPRCSLRVCGSRKGQSRCGNAPTHSPSPFYTD